MKKKNFMLSLVFLSLCLTVTAIFLNNPTPTTTTAEAVTYQYYYSDTRRSIGLVISLSQNAYSAAQVLVAEYNADLIEDQLTATPTAYISFRDMHNRRLYPGQIILPEAHNIRLLLRVLDDHSPTGYSLLNIPINILPLQYKSEISLGSDYTKIEDLWKLEGSGGSLNLNIRFERQESNHYPAEGSLSHYDEHYIGYRTYDAPNIFYLLSRRATRFTASLTSINLRMKLEDSQLNTIFNEDGNTITETYEEYSEILLEQEVVT
jgi:hypothetical protein